MSTENQNIPPNTETPEATKGAAAAPTSSLLTPNATPEVEDGRVEAERRRAAAAAQQVSEPTVDGSGNVDVDKATTPQSDAAAAHRREVSAEIQRILGCADDSYAEIMGVKTDATVKEKEVAWRRLGCLLHKRSTDEKDSEKAFNKLRVAAEKLEVNHLNIDEVLVWDGEQLPDHDEDEDHPMPECPIPVPPPDVLTMYEKATPALHHLGENPDDPEARKSIADVNEGISNLIAAGKKEDLGVDASDISPGLWSIPMEFFTIHYKLVMEKYNVVSADRTNLAARNDISKEKELIDAFIEKHHFPKRWTVLTADAYLEAPAADGSLIIGVRKQGRFGNQVCVEAREEDGRVIRRLQSASEAGLLQVEKYYRMDGYKNLAEGQSEWSCNDRDDFEELLWVTESHTKRKNTAARKKDPTADCCVRFQKRGIDILTVSSFSKVLGRSSARAEIERVCRRDDIATPWDAGYISEYHDPSRLEKNPVHRRALQKAQAESSAKKRLDERKQDLDEAAGKTDRTPEELEDRVMVLEVGMTEMKNLLLALQENMNILVASINAPVQPK